MDYFERFLIEGQRMLESQSHEYNNSMIDKNNNEERIRLIDYDKDSYELECLEELIKRKGWKSLKEQYSSVEDKEMMLNEYNKYEEIKRNRLENIFENSVKKRESTLLVTTLKSIKILQKFIENNEIIKGGYSIQVLNTNVQCVLDYITKEIEDLQTVNYCISILTKLKSLGESILERTDFWKEYLRLYFLNSFVTNNMVDMNHDLKISKANYEKLLMLFHHFESNYTFFTNLLDELFLIIIERIIYQSEMKSLFNGKPYYLFKLLEFICSTVCNHNDSNNNEKKEYLTMKIEQGVKQIPKQHLTSSDDLEI
ncbi:hypothetical protein ABK040_001742 [Willaertia magna]